MPYWDSPNWDPMDDPAHPAYNQEGDQEEEIMLMDAWATANGEEEPQEDSHEKDWEALNGINVSPDKAIHHLQKKYDANTLADVTGPDEDPENTKQTSKDQASKDQKETLIRMLVEARNRQLAKAQKSRTYGIIQRGKVGRSVMRPLMLQVAEQLEQL